MILYERAATAAVRAAEWEIAGRRAAARLMPYLGDAGNGLRFDPLELRFAARREEARVLAGPSDPQAWTEAARRLPPGPLLIGPGSPAERIHASYSAAVRGALSAGRGVYLLDPPPIALAGEGSEGDLEPSAGGSDAVALASWTADGTWEGIVAAAAASGVPAGILLPLFPGWTAEGSWLGPTLDRAAAAGARFAVGLRPAPDGESRRMAVETLAALDPAQSDHLFERLHHRDWIAELPEAEETLAREARARGLDPLAPRPRSEGEPSGNALAADRLERRALESRSNEHVSARYLAAARWIDECGRDLAAILREGNFRRIFPYDGDVAAAAESALAGKP